MTQWKTQYWVIPPKANAEFTAHMENVLDTYAQPYNPHLPIVCMDEQPVQLLEHIIFEFPPRVVSTQKLKKY